MHGALKSIDVFILCGGFGKRLRKISSRTPKPIIEINGRHFLDILIEQMAGYGFRNFILGIGYKAGLIRKHYKNYCLPGVKISFSEEKVPLGTGGAVKHAKKMIYSNPFLVLNGDSFCKFNPLEFLKFHNKKKSLVSILLRKVKNTVDYGSVKLDKNSRIINFSEKKGLAKRCLINAGAYIFDRRAFALMPRKSVFSIEYDFFPALCGKRCFGYAGQGFFIDIGTPGRYLKAKKYFKKKLPQKETR